MNREAMREIMVKAVDDLLDRAKEARPQQNVALSVSVRCTHVETLSGGGVTTWKWTEDYSVIEMVASLKTVYE